MIIVSASLPKSGSTWLFHMTEAILIAAGHPSYRDMLDRPLLRGLIKERSGDFGYANPAKLARMLPHATRGRHLLVRTHYQPSRTLRTLIRLGYASATYVYRDPRDVVLSAIDHGERARRRGSDHELSVLRTVDDGIRYAREELFPHHRRWMAAPGTLRLRYEDVTADPVAAMTAIARHLGIDVSQATIEDVVRQFDKSAMSADEKARLLINKATSQRFRREMTEDEVARTTEAFRAELEEMGYAA